MVDINTTEEQQVEAIKNWFAENAIVLILGAVLGFGGYFGYKYYQSMQVEKAMAASDAFVALKVLQEDETQAEAFQQGAEKLLANHADTVYADFTRLALAKAAVDNKDYQQAIEHLTPLMTHAQHKALQHTAKLRIARLYLQLGEHDKALALVSADEYPKAYQAQYLKLKGDAYLAAGNKDLARSAYLQAKAAQQDGSNRHPTLDMLIENLAEPEIVVEEAPATEKPASEAATTQEDNS